MPTDAQIRAAALQLVQSIGEELLKAQEAPSASAVQTKPQIPLSVLAAIQRKQEAKQEVEITKTRKVEMILREAIETGQYMAHARIANRAGCSQKLVKTTIDELEPSLRAAFNALRPARVSGKSKGYRTLANA